MIREATHADIPAMMECARRFAATIKLEETVGFDETSVAGLLTQLIESPGGICLIAEDGSGGAGGLVHPSMFNSAHLTGSELFWWVDPDKRGRVGLKLFWALEDAARERGAQSWMVSTMEALDHDGASKFYERRGYRPSDRNYIKRF
jgi:GNAT superfamily N-acetyltransferase